MQFERYIKYLDYLEGGERVKGAGFFKLQTKNGKCDLQIQVSGLHVTDNFSREVFVITGEGDVVLREISLKDGRGNLKLCGLDCENLAGTGVPYEELLGIRIPVAAGKEIRGIIREGIRKEPQSEEKIQDTQIQDMHVEEVSVVEAQFDEVMAEEVQQKENLAPDFVSTGLAEHKWLQLWNIYPRIIPFKDEREYLSIGPGDFVILPGKYYKMANNSFLLHGYYNYKHLILCRVEQKGQPVYYIGVPGNYYDREKEVALLFGFESFECAKEPVRMGDYGYYMMRVEL